MRRPSTSRTWPASNGSIMACSRAMRRIQLSDLMLMSSCFCRSAARRARKVSGFLDDDLGKYAAAVARARRQRPGGAARHREVRLGARRIGGGNHRGTAAVGLGADVCIERQLAQQSPAIVARHALAAAAAEDVLAVAAVRADVHAHVL